MTLFFSLIKRKASAHEYLFSRSHRPRGLNFSWKKSGIMIFDDNSTDAVLIQHDEILSQGMQMYRSADK